MGDRSNKTVCAYASFHPVALSTISPEQKVAILRELDATRTRAEAEESVAIFEQFPEYGGRWP